MPTKIFFLRILQGKLIQYQEQWDLAFNILVKSQMLNAPIDLDILLSYSLSPVPHCLGTPDGFFSKTNKASVLRFLMEVYNAGVQYPKGSKFIQDENALFHTLVNLPPTFGGFCLKILNLMVSKKSFVFSTDSHRPDSIKMQERQRRGCGEYFILDWSATRKPEDFKVFLTNDANKNQLCEVLLKVLGSPAAATCLQKCTDAVIIVEGTAHRLRYSNKKVNFIVHFHFNPNYIPSASSTITIISITSWHFTF